MERLKPLPSSVMPASVIPSIEARLDKLLLDSQSQAPILSAAIAPLEQVRTFAVNASLASPRFGYTDQQIADWRNAASEVAQAVTSIASLQLFTDNFRPLETLLQDYDQDLLVAFTQFVQVASVSPARV